MNTNIEIDLLIWDVDVTLPASTGPTLLWRACSANTLAGSVSIPQLIEENADSLRARYLAWVYELGELRLHGRRLIDHLQLRTGCSYWWMTLLVEKCNYGKSPKIDDLIRLLAFNDWAAGSTFARISLVSANRPLSECLHEWCDKRGVAFEWRRSPMPVPPLSWARRAYVALPAAMQAWLWFMKYLLERWPLRGVGLQEWQQTTGSITFISYLCNLVPEAAKAGRFESRYWGHLPEALQHDGTKTNWLHLYVKDSLLPDAKKAADVIRTFNMAGKSREVHAALDTFLNLHVVLHSILDWLKLAWKGVRLKGPLSTATQFPLNLWPLIDDDWRESTRGVTSMSNVLYSNLFNAALKVLPEQKMGCYLQENQGWEFALIQKWKVTNHNMLIGVPHSSVRFWDLRYYFDSRSYRKNKNKSMPLPDRVAVNGQAATSAFLTGGYPADELVQVEALRYLYLDNAKARSVTGSSGPRHGLRLLVLGDYLARNTQLQMDLLAKASGSLPEDTVITVKPHPVCPIRTEDYPELPLKIAVNSLETLLADCDVVYTSAFTTAAVDAYCAGVPVVSVLDPTTLNMSPLRGCVGTFYASSADSLIQALQAIHSTKFIAPRPSNFFNLNTSLPLWRRLLTNLS